MLPKNINKIILLCRFSANFSAFFILTSILGLGHFLPAFPFKVICINATWLNGAADVSDGVGLEELNVRHGWPSGV